MRPVSCHACDAEVTARKSSWDQMTVQWSATALTCCLERQAAFEVSDRPNRQAFPGCDALKASVRAAAVTGALEVHSDEPLPTNAEGTAHQ